MSGFAVVLTTGWSSFFCDFGEMLGLESKQLRDLQSVLREEVAEALHGGEKSGGGEPERPFAITLKCPKTGEPGMGALPPATIVGHHYDFAASIEVVDDGKARLRLVGIVGDELEGRVALLSKEPTLEVHTKPAVGIMEDGKNVHSLASKMGLLDSSVGDDGRGHVLEFAFLTSASEEEDIEEVHRAENEQHEADLVGESLEDILHVHHCLRHFEV